MNKDSNGEYLFWQRVDGIHNWDDEKYINISSFKCLTVQSYAEFPHTKSVEINRIKLEHCCPGSPPEESVGRKGHYNVF